MHKQYDVIIVGAGPAGIFAAMHLVRPGRRVLLVEKGHPLDGRFCPGRAGRCLNCRPCAVMSGWGGAGAFSDGKLTLSSRFGGSLPDYVSVAETEELIARVDKLYCSYGAPSEIFGADGPAVDELKRKAAAAGLEMLPAVIRHLGTENCLRILATIKDSLAGKLDCRFRSPVSKILVEEKCVKGVQLESGEVISAPYVVCGTGREGSLWLLQEAERLGLTISNNPVDVGIRVEVPAKVLEEVTSRVYESKLIYTAPTFGDRVRTFCMNPYGEVVLENCEGVVTVNGHSYREKERQSGNTNFALLVSKNFTIPFKEPVRYGRYIASLANMLGGGVLLQRLGDLLAGRRSTPERINKGEIRPTLLNATPGDLSLVLPYRYLCSLLEMLSALDKLVPGIYSPHTLLYGVEVKFYSNRLRLTSSLETEVNNFFAIGDGAGVTRGLVQASASGMLAAAEISRRLEIQETGSRKQERKAHQGKD